MKEEVGGARGEEKGEKERERETLFANVNTCETKTLWDFVETSICINNKSGILSNCDISVSIHFFYGIKLQ